jgi:hypothetical protein
MAKKCGECHFFQGPSQQCVGGAVPSANQAALDQCFKGPASLFTKKACGSCRLFQGSSRKCGGGGHPSANQAALDQCYAPIPG